MPLFGCLGFISRRGRKDRKGIKIYFLFISYLFLIYFLFISYLFLFFLCELCAFARTFILFLSFI